MVTNNIQLISAGVYGFEKTPDSGGENLSPAKMGIVGWTDQGPTHTPTEVRSVEEFTRVFGPVTNLGVVPLEIRGFFVMGGERAVVVRVAAPNAVAATVTAGVNYLFTMQGEGIWGNEYSIRIKGNKNFLDRSIGAEKWDRFDIIVIGPSPASPDVDIGRESFEAVQLTDPDVAGFVVDVVSDPSTGSGLVDIAEILSAVPSQLLRTAITAASADDAVAATLGPYSGTLASLPVLSLTLRIFFDRPVVAAENTGANAGGAPLTRTYQLLGGPSLKRGTLIITYTNVGPFTITDVPASEDASGNADLIDSFNGAVIGTVNYNTRTFTFTTAQTTTATATVPAAYTPQYCANDDGLGGFTNDVNTSATNTIDYDTGAWLLTFDNDAAAVKGGPFPLITVLINGIKATYVKLPLFFDYAFSGGLNGSAVSRAAISHPNLEVTSKGIYALDRFDQPLNLIVPDFEGSQAVQADVVQFCEDRANSPTLKNRIFIAGFAKGTTINEAVKYVTIDQVGSYDSKTLATYYNNIRYRRDDNVVQTIPITGFVAGIYSRTAQIKNIGRAPAGIGVGVISGPGIVGPEFELTRQDMDKLYEVNINPVFKSDATGYIINGARLQSLDPRWKFVNTRTLNDFLMFRIDRILQFAVFENNGPSLWAQASEAVSGFLTSLFRLGFFGGATTADSFSVKIDSSNNDRSTNIMNVDVGFTAGTPTEYVVFRVQQPTRSVTTA